MKKFALLSVLIIAGLILAGCAPAPDVVTVAVENQYLPFNYIDSETREPTGWDYEVWDELCKRMGCTPDYVETSWEGMIQAVSDGQFDVAADGITITDDRAEIVDFSMGYISLEQKLLVRVDEDREREHREGHEDVPSQPEPGELVGVDPPAFLMSHGHSFT